MAHSILLWLSFVALSVLCNAQDLPPLQRVNVPLSVNEDRRYVADVNMSGGQTSQKFKFALVSNTGYSGVANVSCGSCGGAVGYVMDGSPTARALTGSTTVNLGASIANGSFIKEDCSLQTESGSPWQYPNQTIVLVNSSSSFFTQTTSGFIGLGTNANGQSGDFVDTVFGGWLLRNPGRSNFSYGMALRSPDDSESATDGGVLHWVVPDSSAHEGAVAQVSAQVSPRSEVSANDGNNGALSLPESDWAIQLDQWAASFDGGSFANSTAQLAIIEPWVPNIIFPQSQAEKYYSLIAGANMQSDLVGGARVWSVPCDATPTVTFSFANENFAFNNLVLKNGDGSCTGVIQAWADNTSEVFLLGSRFISDFYLIFTIGRPGSGVLNTIGIARRAQAKSSPNVGAIVGGTIGGVVFLLVVGAAGYSYYVRRQREKANILPTAAVSPYHDNTPTTGFPEKIYSDGRVGGSAIDDDGAQYAIQRPVSYATSSGHYITPPHSARTNESARPLLPEPQSPLSPSLDVPHAENTQRHFASAFTGPQMSAMSSQMTGESTLQTNGQNYIIAPYLVSQNVSTSGQSQNYSSVISSTKGVYQQAQQQYLGNIAVSGSASGHGEPVHTVNPPSSLSGATVEPFVIPSPRHGGVAPAPDRKGPIPPAHVEPPPAPPAYSLRDVSSAENGTTGGTLNSFSPTLVEYNPSSNPTRSSQAAQ